MTVQPRQGSLGAVLPGQPRAHIPKEPPPQEQVPVKGKGRGSDLHSGALFALGARALKSRLRASRTVGPELRGRLLCQDGPG